MTRQQSIRQLHTKLIRRRNTLQRLLAGELTTLHNSDDAVCGDVVDLTVEKDYALINATLAETESEELEQIDKALERIVDGSYGRCCECGKDIPISRLRIIPFATRCFRCQNAIEIRDHRFLLAARWSEQEPAATGMSA